jgi:hypothetical protein
MSMTEEEKIKHARCYELQDLLEPLYVFSSKLKHLQLSYNSLQKVISEINLIMKKDNLEIFRTHWSKYTAHSNGEYIKSENCIDFFYNLP